MPYNPPPRCRHIKVNGTQCGSPALRDKNFCFYHQQNRPIIAECYSDGKYATGEIVLPVFEDAHSIQSVIRQVVQMVLQKRIERKTASLLLYALQIASSNLKRMDQEKPQPEQLVTDVEIETQTKTAIAVAPLEDEEQSASRSATETTEDIKGESKDKDEDEDEESKDEEFPLGTIQACWSGTHPNAAKSATLEWGIST